MTDVVWLASYPKSGNTWTRILVGCIERGAAAAFDDINDIAVDSGVSTQRLLFDNAMMIDSTLLTHDEIDNLRPIFHAAMARDDSAWPTEQTLPVRFVKTHDAYTRTASGEPLLGGAEAAKGAIVIVRDPRDVAGSLANHLGRTVDYAVDFLNDPNAAFSRSTNHSSLQLRQKLLDWSGHVASWLDQRDLPVHLLRYEDLKRDTPGALMAAMHFAGIAITREDAERAAALAAFPNLQALERRSGFREWRYHRPEQKGVFFRRGEAGGWRDELSPAQAARIEAAQAAMMARLGYEMAAGQGKIA